MEDDWVPLRLFGCRICKFQTMWRQPTMAPGLAVALQHV